MNSVRRTFAAVTPIRTLFHGYLRINLIHLYRIKYLIVVLTTLSHTQLVFPNISNLVFSSCSVRSDGRDLLIRWRRQPAIRLLCGFPTCLSDSDKPFGWHFSPAGAEGGALRLLEMIVRSENLSWIVSRFSSVGVYRCKRHTNERVYRVGMYFGKNAKSRTNVEVKIPIWMPYPQS